MKTLSVIIPCYNEQRTVQNVIDKVLRLSIPDWKIEVIVVDDGSKDDSRNILKRNEPKIKAIFHNVNKGKGTTVRTGIDASAGDYLVIQDADLEYNPAEIPTLIAAMEQTGADVVYGSRNIHHEPRRGGYVPRIGTWVTTMEFNILYRTYLTDLWTCYKIFPRAASHLYVAGGFESDLVFSARLAKNGFRSTEIPISYHPRTAAEGKKILYRDGARGLWLLLKERFTK